METKPIEENNKAPIPEGASITVEAQEINKPQIQGPPTQGPSTQGPPTQGPPAIQPILPIRKNSTKVF